MLCRSLPSQLCSFQEETDRYGCQRLVPELMAPFMYLGLLMFGTEMHFFQALGGTLRLLLMTGYGQCNTYVQ